MIVGIGVDIVDTARIARALEKWGDRFRGRILHAGEVREYRLSSAAAAYLARQFAAKEAVSKALGTGMRAGVHFGDIRVLRGAGGAPFVELAGGAVERAGKLGADHIHISISDEAGYAVAYAIAEKR